MGAFDPSEHMRQLRNRSGQVSDYLDVRWRIVWFRGDFPSGTIDTEMLRLSDDAAVFRATVCGATEDGELRGRATGHGSETRGDFGDFIEKAETKAIGRALNALGYGAESSMGDDDAEVGGVTNAPVERSDTVSRTMTVPKVSYETMPAIAPQRTAQRAPAVSAPGDDSTPQNVDAAIKRTMAMAHDLRLSDVTVKSLILGRWGLASRKELTGEQHRDLRAWMQRHDSAGWDVVADAVSAINAATNSDALSVIGERLKGGGVDDEDLRAVYQRRRTALGAGQ